MRSVQNYWVGILQPCPTGEFISSCQTRAQKKFQFIWQKKTASEKNVTPHLEYIHCFRFSLIHCFHAFSRIQSVFQTDSLRFRLSLPFFWPPILSLYLVLSPGTTQMEPNGSPYYRFKFYSDLKGVVPFHSHFPAASSKGFRLWAQ